MAAKRYKRNKLLASSGHPNFGSPDFDICQRSVVWNLVFHWNLTQFGTH